MRTTRRERRRPRRRCARGVHDTRGANLDDLDLANVCDTRGAIVDDVGVAWPTLTTCEVAITCQG
jgi:hypothetical protein